MNKFLTNLGQTFSDDEKAVIKNKLENILGTDQVKMAWYPSVGNDGTIQWGLSAYSTQAPNPANIKGPQGDSGKDGKDGYTPSATTATVTAAEHPNGGTKVTLSWPADASWLNPVAFTAWNGNDGITPDNVVTSGTAQAEEKPWVLSAGQWVNATNLVSMYKTSNTANIKPVTQVLYNYHTYDEDRYNYIEVTDSSNKVWSAHTLIHPMYDSIKFAENGLLTGTCESGVWTLSAKEQGGNYLPLTGGTVDVSTGDGRLRYIMSNNYDATSFVIQRGNNEITLGVSNAGGCVMKAASLNSQLVVNGVGLQYAKTNGGEGSYYAAMSLNESPIKIVTTAELPETTDDNTLYFVFE